MERSSQGFALDKAGQKEEDPSDCPTCGMCVGHGGTKEQNYTLNKPPHYDRYGLPSFLGGVASAGDLCQDFCPSVVGRRRPRAGKGARGCGEGLHPRCSEFVLVIDKSRISSQTNLLSSKSISKARQVSA